MKHSEKTIQAALHSLFSQNCKYRIQNVYLFNWESDFFIQKENGYCYEFEIKISRQDFRNDSKKVDKHHTLINGYWVNTSRRFLKVDGVYQRDENNRMVYTSEPENVHCKRPNKFYYVVPNGMISLKEVPAYAGLIYISESGSMTKIKEAPFLHREKLQLDSDLCNKFYWYWLNQISKTKELESTIQKLQDKLQENNIEVL